MAEPIRLQLSRRKGFDLQALSRATNGFEAINVARPSKWGNPFVVHHPGSTFEKPMTAKMAVANFRAMIEKECGWFSAPLPWPKGKIPAQFTTVEDVKRELRGKNLACWCKPGEPCHADVLLEIANASTPSPGKGE
jgi:hypothetical protein